MREFFSEFLLTFVPLFVAMDAVGTIALIAPYTWSMTRDEQASVANVAFLTAGGIGLLFLFLGRILLRALGIGVGHFAIAGGLILLALSVRELAAGKEEPPATKEEMVAVVPIGTPLISGPAVLTTLVLLTNQYGIAVPLVSFLLNLAIGWLILRQGNRIMGFLGKGGTKAASKIASLFLAAIAVRMIFVGFQETLNF